MRTQIPVPSKGDAMRASWGASVASRVNELCAMAPANMLARDGFGGMGAQPLPANLRDRRAPVGQPMPFDLSAAIETNEEGTQQRLVVKYLPGKVVWASEGLCTLTDDTPSTTLFTGSWGQLSDISGTYAAFLHYKLTVAPEWDTGISPLQFGTTSLWEKVLVEKQSTLDYSPSTLPYNQAGFYYGNVQQTLVGWIILGTVQVSSTGRVTLDQRFHGTLVLSDLLQVDAGEKEDATNGTNYPMPFQYRRTDSTDSQGQTTSTYSIINCRFYWDGEYHTLADYTPPETGTVWLIAAKNGQGSGTWTFRLSTAEGNPANGEQSVRLYDFTSSSITMDYRTTTLMFGPGPRDFFEFKNRANHPNSVVTIDATGAAPKLIISDGTHTVSIDIADIPTSIGNLSIRKLDYMGRNGESKSCYGLLGGVDDPEPGADPENPYEDPEDTFPDDEEDINGDGNEISGDAGSLDDEGGGNGDYCNSIGGLGPGDAGGGGNEISNTCSK